MATKAQRFRAANKTKFAVQGFTRCELCGRPRAVYRKFHICRICFRDLANQGKIPGVRKSSW